jgi:hypothetical protein
MDSVGMQAWHARVIYKSDSIVTCIVFLLVVLNEVNVYFGLFFFAVVALSKYLFYQNKLNPLLKLLEQSA